MGGLSVRMMVGLVFLSIRLLTHSPPGDIWGADRASRESNDFTRYGVGDIVVVLFFFPISVRLVGCLPL